MKGYNALSIERFMWMEEAFRRKRVRRWVVKIKSGKSQQKPKIKFEYEGTQTKSGKYGEIK